MTEFRNNYAVDNKYEAFYTGGKIEVSQDGAYMFCGCGNKINVVETSTGRTHAVIGKNEEEEISYFCLSPDQQYLVIATQNLLLRQWNWSQNILVRTWKAIHIAPIVSMAFDSTSTLLATGGADSTIKLWDIHKKYCTHNLKGHQGLVSVVEFHPDISRLQLFSAGEDYKVRVWDLSTSVCTAAVSAHYSTVTSIVFSADGQTAYSSGRDSIVAVWDAEKLTVIRTIPVFETIESLILLPDGIDFTDIGVTAETPHVVTAGSKGVLRVWNTATSKCVYSTPEKQMEGTMVMKKGTSEDNIIQTVYSPALESVVVVTNSQNISLFNIQTMALQKQLSGNNDEIVDLKFYGENDDHIILITNSMHVKVFALDTWDCHIVEGHNDIVMCVDVFSSKNIFITGSKDNTVRVWRLNPSQKEFTCVAIGQGHTHAVGSVALSRLNLSFFVSGSQDSTLKLWKLPPNLENSSTSDLHAIHTERAHDKDISSLAVAPNDRFIASGSMDKTAKLWSADNLTLLGVMRGHKRGIWCAQFSPIDKALATSSGDGTIKIWSLSDFTCVKTFEGHDCAVLRVTFISRGMQLLSSATDGLVKLWTIKTNECIKTFDEHEDKVWALVARRDGETIVTGGADATLIVWKDVTQTEIAEAREKQEKFILQEQELMNLLQQKKYLKAIGLAITLEQPFRVLTIVKEILSEDSGAEELQSTLEKLRSDQMDAILRFAVKWNTNSRHCHEAQYIVSAIFRTFPTEMLSKFPNVKSSVEGLIPYTERHFQRMNRLLQQAMFVEYTWQCMRNVVTDGSVPSTSGAIESGEKLEGTFAESDHDSGSETSLSDNKMELSKPSKLRHGEKTPLKSAEGKVLKEEIASDSAADDDDEEEDEVDTAEETEDEMKFELLTRSQLKQKKKTPWKSVRKAVESTVSTSENLHDSSLHSNSDKKSKLKTDLLATSGVKHGKRSPGKSNQVPNSNLEQTRPTGKKGKQEFKRIDRSGELDDKVTSVRDRKRKVPKQVTEVGDVTRQKTMKKESKASSQVSPSRDENSNKVLNVLPASQKLSKSKLTQSGKKTAFRQKRKKKL